MTSTFENITILNDIRFRLDGVTDDMIRAAERFLETKKTGRDKASNNRSVDRIGPIAEPVTRRLWVLAHFLELDRKDYLVRSARAPDEEIAAEHLNQCGILSEMHDVVIAMFWAQVRTDLGFWEAANMAVSVTSGSWELVRAPDENPAARLMGPLSGFLGFGGSSE